MRRPLTVLACLLALALALSACGGDSGVPVDAPQLKEPSAEAEADSGDDLLAADAEEPEQKTSGNAGKKRSGGGKKSDGEESGGAKGDGGSASGGGGSGGAKSKSGAGKKEPKFTEEDIKRGDARALALKRELEKAKQVVRLVIEGINAGNPNTCTRHFTQRYMEEKTKLTGEAAVAKCRRDVGGSRGRAKLGPFGPSRIGGRSAFVSFNLRVGDQLQSQHWRLLKGDDGRWRLDGGG